ncbi:reverse transcriptase domain-containing protein [Tanacetum coccineum]
MKQNAVSDDALRLSLFLYSLTHHAIAWYDHLPRNSIHSFDDMMRKFLSKYFPPSIVTKLRNKITKFEQKPHESLFEAWECYKLSIDRCPNHNMLLVTQIDTFYNGLTLSHRDTINAAAGGTFMQKTPKECYDLIENMTAHHNHWDTSATRDETSRNISSTTTTESPEVIRQLEMMNKNFVEMTRQIQTVKTVDTKCETCGGPHSFTECPAVGGYIQEAAHAASAPNFQAQVGPSNELTNYMKSNEATLRAMQTQMTNMKTELRNEFKSTIDARTNKIENQNNQITNILTNTQNPNSLGSGSLPSNTVANPIGDVKVITTQSGVAYDGPIISPTPSPLPKEVERETEAAKDKFASTFKSLLSNKEKLFELESTSLNENCSAMLLKRLLEKLGDPAKFLIPCDFPELDECLALADLGASIHLMPLSVWKHLSLPELTLTRMTLELANQSTVTPAGVAEDVFVKVGKFYFSADFVVVNYEVNPRVALILGRPFLRTARALIDVHGEEMTLRVNDEAITFKVGHTLRYSRNYYDEMVHQVNVIDVACEEYAQEVLGFLDSSLSGNPIPSDPIIASSSPLFTPFLKEEISFWKKLRLFYIPRMSSLI